VPFPFVQLLEFFSKLEGQSHNKAVTAAALRHPKSSAESRFPAACENLLRRHQGMGDGMDGEGDAVLHSDFSHQFRYVRFYCALFDA
jgi:hypothetical protein